MRGHFDLRRCGNAARMMRGCAVSITASAFAPGVLIAGIVDRHAHGDAGIVDDDVERAEMRGDLADHGFDRFCVGDVEPPRFRAAAGRGDLIRNGFGAVGAHVGHRDIGAFGGEHAARWRGPCRWPRP